MNRRKAGSIVISSIMFAAICGSALAQNAPGAAAIDARLRAAVERKDVPGVVALVVNRERVLYQGAFGVADVNVNPSPASALRRMPPKPVAASEPTILGCKPT